MAKTKPDSDAAKSFLDDLRRTQKQFELDNPIIGTKYIVVEGFYKGNEYDYNINWFQRAKFEFDTADERDAWLKTHDPDKYNQFRLARQDLREFHPKPYVNRMPIMWERSDV